MSPFTDYFDNPLSVGDIVMYPSASGSSSAVNNLAKVAQIIPLVQKPGTWLTTGAQARTPWVREDQQFQQYPTEYYPLCDARGKARPDKCFVVRVHRRIGAHWSDKLQFLKNVDRMTVVTSLTSVR